MNINSVKSRYNKKSQKNKSMSFDKKVVQQNAQKPPYSYAELIAQAIISVPSYKLPLNKIYEWISTHYPFYKLSETGWQNSIRHNLSLNNSFVKCPRTEEDPGKGCYWTIVKDQRQKFESQLSKKLGTSINIIKKSNPKKKYNTYSDSESDLSESDFEEDEDDYPYTDKIIIKQKKVRKNSSRSSDDMLYTEKPKSNKKSKKLAKAVKKTTVPASPTPSPILTKRDGNFSDVKSYDEESEEESENMMMDEESEDDYEAYPPSPQSPDFPPIHLHKKYDFSFDLFSENPKLDDEDDDNEDMDSYLPEQFKTSNKTKKNNGTWIKESDEAIDFLDPRIVSRVIGTRESNINGNKKKNKKDAFKQNDSGKMIINDSEEEDNNDDMNEPAEEDYYMQSVKSADRFTRTPSGRVKFNKTQTKRGRSEEDDFMDEDDDYDEVKNNKRGKGENGKIANMLGRNYKAKNAAGDVKKKNQLDPYAYIPLNSKIVGNKRKSAKVAGSFKNIIRAAQKGSTEGHNSARKQRIAQARKGNKKHK